MPKQPRRHRRLTAEGLEPRQLLAGDFGGAISFGSPNSSGLSEVSDITTDAAGNYYLSGVFSGKVDFDNSAGVSQLTSAGARDCYVAKYAPDGTLQWARRWGGKEIDFVMGVAVDGNGNVLIGGQFDDVVDFDPGAGVDLRTTKGFFDNYLLKLDAAGNFVFAKTWGGDFVDHLGDVGVDAAGNAYVLSDYSGAVDLDPGPVAVVKSSGLALSKFDPAGNLVRLSDFAGSSAKDALELAITPSGEAFLVGASYFTDIDLDPGPGTTLHTGDIGQFIVRLDAQGHLVYGVHFGGDYNSLHLADISVDLEGNLYAAGQFAGEVDFDPGAGTNLRTSAGGNDPFLLKLNPSGQFDSVQTWGGAQDDVAYSVAAVDDRVLVSGRFTLTADLKPGPDVWESTNPNGFGESGFLLQFLSDGTWLQASSFHGTYGAVQPYAVAGDSFGNAYLGGLFSEIMDADPGPGVDHLQSVAADLFVIKLDLNLNRVFSHHAGAPYGGIDIGRDVAIDPAGNVLLAGQFSNTVDFDPGANEWLLTATSNAYFEPDAFLAKYTPSGELLWARSWGTTSSDDILGVAADPSGNVYISGLFNGTIDFDPGPGTALRSSQAPEDLYLLKLNAAGEFVSVFTYRSFPVFEGGDLASDAAGNVYLAGQFAGTVDFDPGPGVVNRTEVTGGDTFVAKYTPAGALVYVAHFCGTALEIAQGLAVAADGSVVVSGSYFGTADFDPGPGVASRSSAGTEDDAFVVKLNAAGELVYVSTFTGTGRQNALNVAIDAFSNAYVLGHFGGPTDFDPGPGEALRTATQPTVYVAKLDAAGNLIWVSSPEGEAPQIADDIELDADGNVLFTGLVMGTTDFVPGVGTLALPTSSFLASYTPTGEFNYVRAIGNGAFGDQANAIAIDLEGNTWITGGFAGKYDFDPGAGQAIHYVSSANASTDVYLLRLLNQPTGSLTATLDGLGNLVVNDLQNNNNQLTVAVVGGQIVITDPIGQFHRAPAGGTLANDGHQLSYPLALLRGGLIVQGGGGNDTLFVGDVGTLRELQFKPGAGFDQVGSATQQVTPSRTTAFRFGLGDPVERLFVDLSLTEREPAILLSSGQLLIRGYQQFQFAVTNVVTATIAGATQQISVNSPSTAALIGSQRNDFAAVSLSPVGNAALSYRLRIGALTVDAPAVNLVRFFGGDGNDVWVHRDAPVLANVEGNAGDDFLVGGNQNDLLRGGAGNDRLFGGGGNDYLHDDAGNNYLSGGMGDDRLYGSSGVDLLRGDEGNDLLVGHAGNDDLSGGDGHDWLIAGTGSDQLSGGLGNDLLISGETNNSQSFIPNDGADSTLLSMFASWIASHPANIATSTLSPDDAASDTLTGGTGSDDFYLGALDSLTDFNSGQSDRQFP